MMKKILPALLAGACAFTAAASDPKPRTAVGDPDQRAAAVEAQMTDEERFHFLQTHLPLVIEPGKPTRLIPNVPIAVGRMPAIERLGTPEILETDASLGVVNPLGLREGDVATVLPSSLALAATFDPALSYRAGAMVAAEARAKGFNVLLAPGVNLTRDPRGGRNFEYFGEDPLLSGVLAGDYIRGVQDAGVVATIKHFALNDQETLRRSGDAQIAEAALRESDLLAFEIGIERGQPGAVMCAYNKVNGDYACGNDFLLNRVLKGDWAYKGWVMSDWGAVHDVGFFNAGLDQQSGAEMDKRQWFAEPLKAEFAAGRVSRQRLSDAVRRILRSLYAVGADAAPVKRPIDYEAHAAVARAVAADGIVLLKNDQLLPLTDAKQSILIVGGYAIAGVMSGGGSSQVTPVGGPAAVIPTDVHHLAKLPLGQILVPSSPVQALKAALPSATIAYDAGYDVAVAAARAARADLAIVFASKWETEGRDSGSLSLGGAQNELIAAVAKANPKTVVVLETGNPVLMPWRDEVKAVVEAWYPGQKGGEAIADVLSGAVNPSGRLPITFPASESQNLHGALPGLGEEYGLDFAAADKIIANPEGAEVGYRGYAARGQTPLFAFGHGLSYTRFELGPVQLKVHRNRVAASFSVRNIGAREGKAAPQLYLVKAKGKPVLRLCGFAKLALKPGERRELSVTVDPRLLAGWESQGWRIRPGQYEFALGDSATDLGPAQAVTLADQRLPP
ncbi:beta-glucosidase family protein [Solimonas variicoloris]|uniref:beta-glucosidase n=1 Tax=Solimonas variicoloris TaxID=254408 RepID=UPI0012B611CA